MARWIAEITALMVLWTAVAAAEPPALERAMLELIVNGAARGETFVLLRGRDVLVPLQSLRRAGLLRLDARTEEHDGVQHVSLQAASPPLSFSYDERSLTLNVTAPPSALALTQVDLSALAPDDVRYDYAPSLFFNYAPRLVNGRDFQSFAEMGVSLGSVLAETALTYSPDQGPTRLASKVTFDDRANVRTATLGDTFVTAGPLGGGLLLGGLSLARNFALDPYLVKIPRLGFTGSAMSPSTVDVYVNDVLIRRVPVDPGEFQLTNVTPFSGAGTTRYVLRDAYGQEQRLESTYYASNGVLAAGLSEYVYGVGLVREEFGVRSFSYGEPAAIARHRFGLTDHVTPGLHAELGDSRANLGTELTLAGEFGEVELHAAGSATTQAPLQTGVAGILSYGYRRSGTSARTTLRYASQRFATLSLDPEQYRNRFENVTSATYALASRTSLAADLALALSHTSQAIARLTLTLTSQLWDGLGLQVRASRSQFELGRWEHQVFATLSWALPHGHLAQLTEQLGDGGHYVTGRLSRPTPQPTGLGYQVSGSAGALKHAAANVQGQASFGRFGATYTNTQGREETVLEASGGVVMVGGDVHLTRPISQGFAVLEVPGAEGVRGYLNNREVGTTGDGGRLFVPELLAHQPNRLRINQADLPLNFQIEKDEIRFSPPSRGGAVVRFPARPLRITRGRIAQGRGRHPPPVKYGTLEVSGPNGAVTSLLGDNGEFELEGLPEGRWQGEVESVDGRCRVSVTIRPTEDIIQNLGTLRCTAPAAEAPR